MKIIFFGSPQFAVPSLQALIAAADIEICAVVTQPDKPAGRGKHLTPPPVKETALAAGLEIAQPAGVRKPAFSEWCASFSPDFLVVVAYGKILPSHLLAVPRHGCVNLHSSLLPKFRGAAPINWAIVRGETETGVTTMLMDEGMDTGPMLLQECLSIKPRETAAELTARLAELGAPLLVRTLRDLLSGGIAPRAQNHELATYAPLIAKDEGVVNWSLSAREIYNRWRGFYPWPGLLTWLRGSPLKLTTLAPADSRSAERPGTLIVNGKTLLVVCGDGNTVEIAGGQLPGKKTVSGADLINGLRLSSGELLRA